MVKLTGPLMSLAASGTIADAVTFSSWKGRSYAREHVIPSNPKSGDQVSMRAMLTFLAQEWDGLTAASKATWQAPAAADSISPFNAFLKTNLQRWPNFLDPVQNYPVVAGSSPDGINNELATAGLHGITLTGDIKNIFTLNWGVVIFRALASPVVPTISNAIAVIPALSNVSFTYVDQPLAPDTYYYQFRTFVTDEKMSANQTEVNATVT